MEADTERDEQMAELVAKIVDLEEEVLRLRTRVRVLSTALTDLTLQKVERSTEDK
jgi:hypothetical protein